MVVVEQWQQQWWRRRRRRVVAQSRNNGEKVLAEWPPQYVQEEDSARICTWQVAYQGRGLELRNTFFSPISAELAPVLTTNHQRLRKFTDPLSTIVPRWRFEGVSVTDK